jgi:hypothetical protein
MQKIEKSAAQKLVHTESDVEVKEKIDEAKVVQK